MSKNPFWERWQIITTRGKKAADERTEFCTSLRGPSTNESAKNETPQQSIIMQSPMHAWSTNNIISNTIKGIVIHNNLFVHIDSVIIDCILLVDKGARKLFCAESVCKVLL